MKRLYRFLCYWWENIKTAYAGYRMIVLLLGILLVLLSYTGLPFRSGVPDWCIRFITIIYIIWCVLWVPFVRHEKRAAKQKARTDKSSLRAEKKLIFSINSEQGRAPDISNSYGHICQWYRIDVRTKCPGGIKECRGRLLRIRKGEEARFDHQEAILTFDPGEQPDAIAKHVYPKAEFHLDVFYITNENEIKIAVWGRNWRYQPTRTIFSEQGIYALDIVVIGEEMEPAALTVLFNWTGNWLLSGLIMPPLPPQ